MSNSKNSDTVCDSTNLDSLLDDALQDFSKPIPPKKSEETPAIDDTSNTNVWTDEFIAAATQNFEATMKTILSQQKDTKGEGKPTEDENIPENTLDLGAMSAEFAKFAETAAQAATASSSDKDFTQCLSDTMQQLAKNKEEVQAAASAEDLTKMFEGFGLGETGTGDGGELGGLFPLLQTMLENILSKDVLYPPLKDIVTQYPDWLADNRSNLSEEDFDRYNKQYDIMKQVVEKFEKASDDDSEKVKAHTSENILLLMQKLQELGQPPRDLMGDYDPSILNMDGQGNSQMPDLAALLGSVGFPAFGASDQGNASENATAASQSSQSQTSTTENAGAAASDEEQCVIM